MDWVVSRANEWEGYSNYLEEGAEISRIWDTARYLIFDGACGHVT